MRAGAYYNENNPFAAQSLRNLIAANLIAPGIVDERDIRDIKPHELDGFLQCHFFAGIGGWSHALRLAGWRDDRAVWTGSCPCQPFSAAGKGGGFADERHLWPSFHWLIERRTPPVVFGEQVASKDGLAWIDLVQDDMEGSGYAFRAHDLCAAGVGAPHIRQRLWFVADSDGRDASAEGLQRSGQHGQFAQDGGLMRMADSNAARRGAGRPAEAGIRPGSPRIEPARFRDARELDNAERAGLERYRRDGDDRHQPGWIATPSSRPVAETGAVGGFWRDANWIECTDGKARPVEPGTFPLAHGAPARMGRLRAYGNAIVAPLAAEFIMAAMESMR